MRHARGVGNAHNASCVKRRHVSGKPLPLARHCVEEGGLGMPGSVQAALSRCRSVLDQFEKHASFSKRSKRYEFVRIEMAWTHESEEKWELRKHEESTRSGSGRVVPCQRTRRYTI